MEKILKINVPEGYMIDKKKSTFENIVFKKIDDVVIEWCNAYPGVVIKADGEQFVVSADRPSYCCNWNDAVRFYTDSMCWKLPTVKQLQVLAKHIDKVNEVIRENNGYEIIGWFWSCEEKDKLRAWHVDIYSGDTYNDPKIDICCVRAVCAL